MTIPAHETRDVRETLAYIRQTMESASSFTALSGWGIVGVGGVGLLAAALAWRSGAGPALALWLPAALVAVAISGAANVAKARRMAVPLWSGSLRKIAWIMTPALAAGAMLTWALHRQGATHLLPGTWLALYGAGVTAGGTLSIQQIRWMGLAVLALGALAFARPDLGVGLMGAGFGILHLVFGLYVARRFGG